MQNIQKFLGISDLYRYGGNINNYDIAKFLAIFSMIIDHSGAFFFPDIPALRGLGRIAFPIFFFLIGYSHQYKISYNVLILGLIISVYKAYMIKLYYPLDILVSVVVVRWAMGIMVRKDLLVGGNLIAIMVMLTFWHVASIYILSYGAAGIMFAICGYVKRRENEGIPQPYLPLILVFTTCCNFYFQIITWGDEALKFSFIFSVVSVGLIYYFMTFRPYTVQTPDNLASRTVLFMSRNSLFIYWVHFMLFILLATLLFPERYI